MPSVIAHDQRHTIGAVPCQRRVVQMGPLEQEYGREIIDHVSAGMLFAGVRIQFSSPTANLSAQVPRALRVLQKRHPMLRCRLGWRQKHGFVLEEDPGLVVPFEVRTRKGGRGEDWLEAWHKEFEPMEGKLGIGALRCLLFTGGQEDDVYELMLAVQHFACDGTSAAFLVHELLQHLGNQASEEDVEWGPWEVAFDASRVLQQKYSSLGLSYSSPWLRSLKYVTSLGRMLHVAFVPGIRDLPFAPGHDGWQLGRSGSGLLRRTTTHHCHYQLTVEETALLLQRCREEKTSVTCAATVAFAAAQIGLIHGQEEEEGLTPSSSQRLRTGAHVSVLCSMREASGATNHGNVSPHVANMAINIFPRSSASPDLWRCARELGEALKSFSEEDRLWAAQHSLQYMKLLPLGPNLCRMPNLVVSSWGSNAIQPQYGEIAVRDGLFAQSHRHVSAPMLSMNNMVAGRLNLVCVAPVPRYDANVLDRAFHLGVRLLLQGMASNTSTHTKARL